MATAGSDRLAVAPTGAATEDGCEIGARGAAGRSACGGSVRLMSVSASAFAARAERTTGDAPLRIAMIHPSLANARGDARMRKGGGENAVAWLAEALGRRGHRVHLLTSAYDDEMYGPRSGA